LNLSSTLSNVDLIQNGLSDKYERLYPYRPDGEANEGGLLLLSQEQWGQWKVNSGKPKRKYLSINAYSKNVKVCIVSCQWIH